MFLYSSLLFICFPLRYSHHAVKGLDPTQPTRHAQCHCHSTTGYGAVGSAFPRWLNSTGLLTEICRSTCDFSTKCLRMDHSLAWSCLSKTTSATLPRRHRKWYVVRVAACCISRCSFCCILQDAWAVRLAVALFFFERKGVFVPPHDLALSIHPSTAMHAQALLTLSSCLPLPWGGFTCLECNLGWDGRGVVSCA
jgi:hypothetical protein